LRTRPRSSTALSSRSTGVSSSARRPLHRTITVSAPDDIAAGHSPRHYLDMGAPLRVALIAHDAPKTDMLEWARWNRELLSRAKLYATKHTGELVGADTGLPIELLLSGPQGGDAQIAAMIARREIDLGDRRALFDPARGAARRRHRVQPPLGRSDGQLTALARDSGGVLAPVLQKDEPRL